MNRVEIAFLYLYIFVILVVVHLFHDVFDFILFTVQDNASLLTDLQVLKNTKIFNSIQHQITLMQCSSALMSLPFVYHNKILPKLCGALAISAVI